MKIITIKKAEQKQLMPKYNNYQCGNGVQISDKYKGRKSKVGQKVKNELKNYF